jgi:mRNA-degrading endonuclease RelE of RelBE toxin-antitoxin system
MKVLVAPSFIRVSNKLHPHQKKALDKAVKMISADPGIGTAKMGDLHGISIYKFKANGVEWLLAYRVVSRKELKLLVVGPHENFYRDLKRTKE